LAHFSLWISSWEFRGWLLSLFFVGFGLYELAKQEFCMRLWKETPGAVVESQTVWREQKKGSFDAPLTVHVRYWYQVEGQVYESTHLTTGEPVLFYGVQEAAEFRKRYPPGAPVVVRYASYAPSEATLIAERSSGPWILLGCGIPLLLLVIYTRWRRRHRGEELHPDVDIPLHWE
jgi:hypothetical protein